MSLICVGRGMLEIFEGFLFFADSCVEGVVGSVVWQRSLEFDSTLCGFGCVVETSRRWAGDMDVS